VGGRLTSAVNISARNNESSALVYFLQSGKSHVFAQLDATTPYLVDHHHHHHRHHHVSVMYLGHLLTRSGLTYPEVSSKVCHDSLCQKGNSVSVSWVIYYEAFYLHIISSFSCIPVICSKLMFFKFFCNLSICFVICPSVSCCSSHAFHLCCCNSSGVPYFNSLNFATIQQRWEG
jgi:hypothetical protein